jgi:site-specific recombinase XerD
MIQPASSILARALHGFFTEYLPEQRAMSPHTLHSYRDSLKLVLRFIAGKNQDPSTLTMEDLTVPQLVAFLQHLETDRGNKACTRNVRLTALHSFFRFVGGQYPEHLEQARRVLSIPFKRTAIREIEHLDLAEMRAVLDAIDRSTQEGRRDFTLLSLLFNTGARVSEIVELKASDLRLAAPPSIVLHGKGQKTRTCPLWSETAHLLREHLEELGVHPDQPETIFRNHWGRVLTRFGIRFILQKYVRRAAQQVPSLKRKRLHPHCVRHSTALYLLRSGVDLSSIAHWLGHADLNTTNKYLVLDLEAKQEALAKAKPLIKRSRKSGSWRRDPNLIAWLEAL